MTTQSPLDPSTSTGHQHDTDPSSGTGNGKGGHRWMMLVCCIPMVAIAAWLVLAGVAGAGVVLIALLCVALMGFMMAGMGHGSGGDHK